MLMSKAEYARHRGVSRQTVYDWIKKGELVMVGSKIDLEASEAGKSGNRQETDKKWPNRTLEMTWGECWAAIKAADRKAPAPCNDDEIKQRVQCASDELGWSVEFLEDGGIYMSDGDTEYYVTQYELLQNADIAIDLLRRDICYAASESPDDEADWSKEGIAALAEWAR